MTITEQVARFLVSPMAPAKVTWDFMPQAPPRCVTVYGTDTRTPGDEDGARIQIMVRGPDQSPTTPAADAEAVVRLLDGFENGLFIPGGYTILRCVLEGGPLSIGPDENNRLLYSTNFRVHYC